jgi:fluoride exporter
VGPSELDDVLATRARHRRPEFGVDTLRPIALGGAIGALARYGLLRAVPTHRGGFPWGTWTINIVGSAALGLLLGAVIVGAHMHPRRRAFLATGVLGAFTTFSTMAIEADQLVGAHRFATSALYLALSVVVGLGALTTGARLTRFRHQRRIVS